MGVGRLEENKRSLFLYLSNLNSHGGRTKFPLLFPSIQAYWNYSYLSPCERRSLFSSKQNMFWFYAYEFALEVYSSFRLIIIFICFFLIQILVYVILDGKFRSWGGGGVVPQCILADVNTDLDEANKWFLLRSQNYYIAKIQTLLIKHRDAAGSGKLPTTAHYK